MRLRDDPARACFFRRLGAINDRRQRTSVEYHTNLPGNEVQAILKLCTVLDATGIYGTMPT